MKAWIWLLLSIVLFMAAVAFIVYGSFTYYTSDSNAAGAGWSFLGAACGLLGYVAGLQSERV